MTDIEAWLIEEAHAQAARTPGMSVHVVDGMAVTVFPGNPPLGALEDFVRSVKSWDPEAS